MTFLLAILAMLPVASREFFAAAPTANGPLAIESLDFSDSTGSSRLGLPSSTRGDVQPVVRAATLLVFKAHLESDADAANQFTADGLKPLLRGTVTSIEVPST